MNIPPKSVFTQKIRQMKNTETDKVSAAPRKITDKCLSIGFH